MNKVLVALFVLCLATPAFAVEKKQTEVEKYSFFYNKMAQEKALLEKKMNMAEGIIGYIKEQEAKKAQEKKEKKEDKTKKGKK